MLNRLLDRIMKWALAKNGGGKYEGEDSDQWAYTIQAPDGSPYLSRILLPRVTIPFVGEFRPMLHHFHQPDGDRDLHNHPWNWAVSLILSGSYEEERLAGDPDRWRYMTQQGICALCMKWRGACEGHPAEVDHQVVRFFNRLTGADYHRVTRLRGDVWTLFVAGSRKPDDEWGFLDEQGRHVPWREFLAARQAQFTGELEPATEEQLLEVIPHGQYSPEWARNLPKPVVDE